MKLVTKENPDENNTHSFWNTLRNGRTTCGGDYYRVNNPAGDKQYYTKEIDQTKSGAITFKDAKSGNKVTLQSSEVKNISKDEFETGIKGLSGMPVETAPAAPAQTSVPVPVPEAAVPGETTAQPIEQK